MDKKVLLGFTAYKNVPSFCFAHHMKILVDGMKGNVIKQLQVKTDMYVTQARNELCIEALELYKKNEVTHLFFVDDDMLIPPGAIKMLLDLDFPVVGGLYFTRDLNPLAYNFTSDELIHYLDDVPETGIIEVDGTGAGCLLIDCALLESMYARYKTTGWFMNDVAPGKEPNTTIYHGEDVYFFRRLKEMGIPARVDCSIRCGHFAGHIVDFDLFKAVKESKQKGDLTAS